jgi:hypothetical protein
VRKSKVGLGQPEVCILGPLTRLGLSLGRFAALLVLMGVFRFFLLRLGMWVVDYKVH